MASSASGFGKVKGAPQGGMGLIVRGFFFLPFFFFFLRGNRGAFGN